MSKIEWKWGVEEVSASVRARELRVKELQIMRKRDERDLEHRALEAAQALKKIGSEGSLKEIYERMEMVIESSSDVSDEEWNLVRARIAADRTPLV